MRRSPRQFGSTNPRHPLHSSGKRSATRLNVAFHTPDISTFPEVMRNACNRWLNTVPHLHLRLALIHKSVGSLPQAISVREQYARTGLAPLPYSLLYDWYLECNEKSKAQDALERGVKARDPKAVVKRVEYVSCLLTLVIRLILFASFM